MTDTVVQLETYSVNARAALADAQKLADAARHPQVTARHVLVALLARGWGVDALMRAGHDPGQVLRSNRSYLDAIPAGSGEPSYLSTPVLQAMEAAEGMAATLGRSKVDLECLTRALDVTPTLDLAEWPVHERLGTTRQVEAPRPSFELAVMRASRVLQDLAPELTEKVGPEPRPSFRVIHTLDAILTALLPPHTPPGLRVDPSVRGRLVLGRTDAPSPTIRCGWEPPERITVTIESGERSATQRYAWSDEARLWKSDDGELFADLREVILSLYPEVNIPSDDR